ncbi:hypothetical protein AYI68_g6517, partial [Smittium mucronatum]
MLLHRVLELKHQFWLRTGSCSSTVKLTEPAMKNLEFWKIHLTGW